MGVALFNLTGEDVGNLLHRGADLLVAANGKTIESIGRVELLLRYKGRETMTPVIVCLEYEGILLSWFLCVELRSFPVAPLSTHLSTRLKISPQNQGSNWGKLHST